MFIACGILYGVDSATERTTKIRLALDLYTHNVLDADINFSNPFNNTSTIGFNSLTKDLYTWTMGNQLTYPVKINALGTNKTEQPSFEDIIVPPGTSYSTTHLN
jgi:Olfactomedin-like domain